MCVIRGGADLGCLGVIIPMLCKAVTRRRDNYMYRGSKALIVSGSDSVGGRRGLYLGHGLRPCSS